MTLQMKQLKDDPLVQKSKADLDLFIEMISIKRGYESQAEIVFNRKYLDERIPKMQKDSFGNRYVVIGKEKFPQIMFACHTDTVHNGNSGKQKVLYDSNKKHVFVDKKKTNCLGADDTTGVWLCLEMIRAGVPGLYVFHRGEEAGCVGSRYIVDTKPDFIKNVKVCLSLDRKGTNEVITHQMGRACASDKLGTVLAAELNQVEKSFKYATSTHGAFTDSEVYSEIIPECLNLGVGYYAQHTSNEYQDIEHMIKLRKALIAVNWKNVLSSVTRIPSNRVVRVPLPGPNQSMTPKKDKVYGAAMDYGEMYDYVKENPDVIVEMLMDFDITESDLWDYEYQLSKDIEQASKAI